MLASIGAAVINAGLLLPARKPSPDIATANLTRSYNDISKYKRVPWYHDEHATPLSLPGKVAIVTGATSGIGKAVATELYRMGATVVVTGRDLGRVTKAADAIKQAAGDCSGTVVPMALDLSDLDDVRAFSARFLDRHSTLHYLVMNAGCIPPLHSTETANFPYISRQGYEYMYASNYLGHFLLLNLMLPTIQRSAPARISATSSIVHWFHNKNLRSILPDSEQACTSVKGASFLSSFRQYGNTKLLQVLMCFELQRRLSGQAVTVTPLSPGLIATAIGQAERGADASLPIALPPSEGAKTTMHALLSPSLEGECGYFLQPYYSPLHRRPPFLGGFFGIFVPFEMMGQRMSWGCHKWLPHPDAHRRDFGKQLWEKSCTACGL